MNYYAHFGLFLTPVVVVSLVALSISLLPGLKNSRGTHVFVYNVWILTGLALIFVMTLTPVPPTSTTGFQSLQVAHVVKSLSQKSTFNSSWPVWQDPIANILMTMPLATALALTWSRRRTILTISMLSTSIEITQYFYGHGRNAQTSDVVLNTIGGICGVGLAALGAAIANRLNRTEP